jgi:hypothetical protein
MQIRRPPLVTYNPETGGVTVRPPTSLLQSLGTHVDKFIQGNTGVPFFDCIGVKDAPPLNKFVSLAAKDVESLSSHFLSYLQVRKDFGGCIHVSTVFLQICNLVLNCLLSIALWFLTCPVLCRQAMDGPWVSRL